jgi:hypothetical protein
MYMTEEVKAMKLQTIGSTALLSLLAALSGGDFLFIPSAQAKIPPPQVLAQNPAGRKAEADRLFKQGVEQFQTSQFQAALQSWQQAPFIAKLKTAKVRERLWAIWELFTFPSATTPK